MKRWKIDEARLPPDRIVEFREASLWEQYRWPVLGAILLASLQALLIFGLLVNRARRRRSEAEASLIAEISSRFVNLPPHEVDREILDAQRRLCEFLDIDLIALWQRDGRGSGHFVVTHAHSRQAGPQSAAELREDDFPWCREQMLANRMVSFSSLDDLPEEAAHDREICRAIGVKSNLTIPLTVGGGPLVGVLGLNTIRRECAWPDAMVNRIRLVAQIFANAIARKRADQNLRESEMRLSLATESAEAGLWDLDLATREFWASQKGRQIFEYSVEETIGMEQFRERVHPEDWEHVQEAIKQTLTGGELVDIEYRIRRSGDQEDRWIVSRGRPLLKPNGEPDRIIGLSFDITEQRRRETETLELRNTLAHSARVNLLGQLASALAHELSQPLGAILRNAEAAEIMLRDSAPGLDEIREIVADILRDDHRAGQVIERLRSLLKRRIVEPQSFDLPDVIEEVLLLVRADAATRQVRIESDAAPGLPNVTADRIHLQQILVNLIVNAMDALGECPPEDRKVRIRAAVSAADSGLVEVRVSDNGPGIPPESMNQIFEPFFTSKSNGLGAGLSVSRTLIEAHRGKLWAENEPDGGACFCFTVPIACANISEANLG